MENNTIEPMEKISEQEKDNALREIRKLLHILNTWGNVLVPSLNGKDTSAEERLNFMVYKLTATGLSYDDIDNMLVELSKAESVQNDNKN